MPEVIDIKSRMKVANETTPPNLVPNQTTIEALEEMLDLAKRGEIKGFAMVPLWHDNTASYLVMGRVGGYAMLGALQMVSAHLVDINLDGEGDA